MDPLLNQLLPNKVKPSLVYFGHDWGENSWEHFVLSFLVFITTITMAEALPKMMQIVFKHSLKVHDDYDHMFGFVSLLIANYNLSTNQIREVLKYITNDEKLQNYYSSPSNLNKEFKQRISHYNFYKGNFWELLYFFVKMFIYFSGIIIMFYILNYDPINLIISAGLSSVVILYGFMPYIICMIAFVILLYTNRLSVGKIITIPGHDEYSIIIEISPFSTKVGRLNPRIIPAIIDAIADVSKNQTTSKIETSSNIKKDLNEEYDKDPGIFYDQINGNIYKQDQNILRQQAINKRKVKINKDVIVPIPLPIPFPQTTTEDNSKHSFQKLTSRIIINNKGESNIHPMVYGFAPNNLFTLNYHDIILE
jgi:hypothetical protein